MLAGPSQVLIAGYRRLSQAIAGYRRLSQVIAGYMYFIFLGLLGSCGFPLFSPGCPPFPHCPIRQINASPAPVGGSHFPCPLLLLPSCHDVLGEPACRLIVRVYVAADAPPAAVVAISTAARIVRQIEPPTAPRRTAHAAANDASCAERWKHRASRQAGGQ